MNFNHLDEKLALLNAKRPLPSATLRTLKENELLEWTYHSNAIEGNTLTLTETKVVLEGITIGGKTMREHLEAINHKQAILHLEDLVLAGAKLTEHNIRGIHQLVLKEVDSPNAGRYRTENVIISGAKHKPPEHFLVAEQMQRLVKDLEAWQRDRHPLETAARLHVEFVKIHPFVDGNGRTARLLMNFIAIKNGFPALVIRAESRRAYYSALDLAHTTGDYAPFLEIVASAAQHSLDFYLSVI